MAGYAVAPGATNLLALLWTTVGTGLCVASANTINQWMEVPYDAQMSRTRNRPLVRHAISPVRAFSLGIASGVAGVATLGYLVNPIVAVLGGINIILYTSNICSNTWVGAVVGGIPPMMGLGSLHGCLGWWRLAFGFHVISHGISLRYALTLFPICMLAPYIGMTSWIFALDSSLVNALMALGAYRFLEKSWGQDCSGVVFFASLIHLPVLPCPLDAA
ncbi:hypothetical protein BC829DRAFT_427717 [Chytridium lagenaria]|nr:hypothetical protein BC829DRAFT_427717 [Chytridium lagenaria]